MGADWSLPTRKPEMRVSGPPGALEGPKNSYAGSAGVLKGCSRAGSERCRCIHMACATKIAAPMAQTTMSKVMGQSFLAAGLSSPSAPTSRPPFASSARSPACSSPGRSGSAAVAAFPAPARGGGPPSASLGVWASGIMPQAGGADLLGGGDRHDRHQWVLQQRQKKPRTQPKEGGTIRDSGFRGVWFVGRKKRTPAGPTAPPGSRRASCRIAPA